MENASKALIIAGSILIAVLLVSLGIVVYNNMKEPIIDMANLNEQEIQAFNSKLTPYLGSNISGSQVNALIQTIASVNQQAKSSADNVRRVEISFPSAVDGSAATLSKEGIYSGNSRKVATGRNFYTVTVEETNGGLISKIKVTAN